MYLNSVSVFLLLSVYFVLFLRISSLMFNIAEILLNKKKMKTSVNFKKKDHHLHLMSVAETRFVSIRKTSMPDSRVSRNQW